MHLLPIYPSSGDGGFAPLCYDDVDPHFGKWEDVEAIAKEYDLMLELMVNHISPKSAQFQDFLEKGDASEHASMFIDWQKFWGSPGVHLTLCKRFTCPSYGQLKAAMGKGSSRCILAAPPLACIMAGGNF